MLLGLQTFLFRESNPFITAVVWVSESQLKKTCWGWDNPGSAKQAMIFIPSFALPAAPPCGHLRAESSQGTKS